MSQLPKLTQKVATADNEGRCDHRQGGFTLLEVLLAIGITALIGVGTWQLLSGTITAEEITRANADSFSSLQQTMLFIERDMQQLISRPVRNPYGDFEPTISNRNSIYSIEFTRAGWRNPLGDARSELQRVAYEFTEEEGLIRYYWRVLDQAQDSTPVSQNLGKDYVSFQWRFLTEQGSWTSQWPTDETLQAEKPAERYTTLPKAIELTLEHKRFGEMVRLFDMPVVMQDRAKQEQDDSEGEEGAGSQDGETPAGSENPQANAEGNGEAGAGEEGQQQ